VEVTARPDLHRPPPLLCRSLLGFALGVAAHLSAQAEALPSDELERACWLQYTRERTRVRLVEPTAVDVSNLRDGMVVNSPFRVDFSIRGMGVIPAGKPHPKAGHHHMLVDATLPSNPGTPIPFNDFHRHFGKGQTGVVMALPPGVHRLRLLFADHDHKPYFVYSPEIKLTVRGPRKEPLKVDKANFDTSCKAWYDDEVARPRPEGKRVVISNLRDGEPVVSPINVRFAADGFGVAPKGFGGEGLGYFTLDVLRDGVAVQALDLTNGATQTTLHLQPGAYTLRLRFLDDSGRKDLVPAVDTRITVASQDRL
jgi:hypothetical protein